MLHCEEGQKEAGGMGAGGVSGHHSLQYSLCHAMYDRALGGSYSVFVQ